MEQFVPDQQIYFKCTACSECFLEEAVFLAHSRTWHCKILISEGNSTSETTAKPCSENDYDQTVNVAKTETMELTEHDIEGNITDEQLLSSAEYNDQQLLHMQDSDEPSVIHGDAHLERSVHHGDAHCSEYTGVGEHLEPSVIHGDAHCSEYTDADDEHLSTIKTETKCLVSCGPDVAYPSTSVAGASNKLSWRRGQQQKQMLMPKETPPQMTVQKSAPVRLGTQNSKVNAEQSQTLMSVTNQKQYQCNLCFYHTAHKTGLIRHIRKHTGEKPYKCSYCDKCFSRNFTLTKHLKLHAT